jgi:hypothetical protein
VNCRSFLTAKTNTVIAENWKRFSDLSSDTLERWRAAGVELII